MGYKFELFGNLKKKQSKIAQSAGSLDSAPASGLRPSSPASLSGNNPVSSSASSSPKITADMQALASSGMSEADMVKEMKNKGYNFKEIDNALSQILKSSVSGDAPVPMPQAAPPEQPVPATAMEDVTSSDTSYPFHGDMMKNDNTEAMIESVVEERLKSFKQLIEGAAGSIDMLKSEIENIDTSLKMLETRTDNVISDMKKEISSVRDDVSSINPKISSVEQAFKDVVPNLVTAISQVNEKLHIKSKKVDTGPLEFDRQGLKDTGKENKKEIDDECVVVKEKKEETKDTKDNTKNKIEDTTEDKLSKSDKAEEEKKSIDSF